MRFARWVPLGDQVMANASNALFMLLVAGASSPAAFGRFAVGYSVLAFAVGIWRSGLSYQISLKAGDREGLREESNRAVAASMLVAPGLAVVVLVLSGVGPGADPALGWGLAIATPFVLTQDLLRYSAVAAGGARCALVSDSAWTLLLAVALILRMTGDLQAWTLILLWVFGAVAATGILGIALGVAPQFAGSRAWISNSWRGRSHLVTGSFLSGLSVPATAAIVAFVAGPAITGGIAGAGVLMAPTNSLVAFLTLTLLARTASMRASDKQAAFFRAGVATAGATLVWGFALLMVPDSLGAALLGETWPMARQAVPIVGVQYGFGVLAHTGTLFLISLGMTRQVLRTSAMVAAARVGFGTAAALTIATVFSVAVAETWAMGVWLFAVFWMLRRTLKSPPG